MMTLLDKVRDHVNRDPVSSMEPAIEALAIAKEHNDNNFLLESNYLYGLSLWGNGKAEEALEYLNIANDLIQEDSPVKLQAYIKSALCISYSLKYEKEKAFNLAKETLSLENYIDDYHCLITIYSRVGGAFVKLSLYSKALSVLIKGSSIVKKDPQFKEEGYIFSHLSIVQTRMKNYNEAIIHSKKSELIFNTIGNHKMGIIATLINRSLNYANIKDFSQGINTLLKVKKLCLEEPNRLANSLSLVYSNLSSFYGEKSIKKYAKALDYAEQAYKLAERNKIKNIICLTLSQILRCSTILNKKIPDFLITKFKEEKDILNHILELSKTVDDLTTSIPIYNNIIEHYTLKEDYKEAFSYQKELLLLNEKKSEKEKNENLFALNIKYETFQKEIKLQQLELEKKELELQQKEELKKVNKTLENKVKKRTSELLTKNHELEQYAYIVAHDLKEPIRSIVGFSQLIERRSKEELSDSSKELLKYVIDASYNMREMVDDLLKFSTIHVNKENYKEINLNDLLEKVLLGIKKNIQENNATVIINKIPQKIIGDNIRIRQLFQNIISNAIKFKHPDRNPVIKINGVLDKGRYTFTIEDNGIGINEEYYKKIFLLFKRLHTKEKFSGSGIGLSVCQKIVRQHGGKIWVSSTEGKGTIFHFTLN